MLPSKVGNVTLQKLSFTGAGLAGSATGSDTNKDVEAALGLLGKSLDDVSVAVAGGEGISVGLYQVAGVDASRLLDVLNQAATQGGEGLNLSDANKGGKSVRKGTDASSGETIYFYPRGDILFFVTGDDDALVTQALQELP
jgi:hypothetical protein